MAQTLSLDDLLKNFGRIPAPGGGGAMGPPGGGSAVATAAPGNFPSPYRGGGLPVPRGTSSFPGERFMGQAQRVPVSTLPNPLNAPPSTAATLARGAVPMAARAAGAGGLALYPSPVGEGSDVPEGNGAPGFGPTADTRQYPKGLPKIWPDTGGIGEWANRRAETVRNRPVNPINNWIGETVAGNLDLGRQMLGLPMQHFQPVGQPGDGTMTAPEYFGNREMGFVRARQGPGLPRAEDYPPGEIAAASPYPTAMGNVGQGEGLARGMQNGQAASYGVDAQGNVQKTLNGQPAAMGVAGGRGGLTLLEGDLTADTQRKEWAHELAMETLRQGGNYDVTFDRLMNGGQTPAAAPSAAPQTGMPFTLPKADTPSQWALETAMKNATRGAKRGGAVLKLKELLDQQENARKSDTTALESVLRNQGAREVANINAASQRGSDREATARAYQTSLLDIYKTLYGKEPSKKEFKTFSTMTKDMLGNETKQDIPGTFDPTTGTWSALPGVQTAPLGATAAPPGQHPALTQPYEQNAAFWDRYAKDNGFKDGRTVYQAWVEQQKT